MVSRFDKIIFFGLGALFIALNAWLMNDVRQPIAAALPIVAYLVFASIWHTDKVLLFMFFCAPLSMNLEDLGDFGVGFYLPTEPILFGLTVLFVLDQLRRPSLDRRVLLHPISIAIYAYLIWLLVTSITSEMPSVSFKFLASRIWFIVPIYFYGTKVFRDVNKSIRALWLYLVPLTTVIIYTLIRHAATGFAEDPAHYVMTPFFKDHTS